MEKLKVGLVLSGGGAKGAYQVGVVKALSELGAQVDAISGASIGALNGAILASSPSLAEGAQRLEEVWLKLAQSSPLVVKMPKYFNLLAIAGLNIQGLRYLDQIFKFVTNSRGKKLPDWLSQWAGVSDALSSGALSHDPLHQLMDKYLHPDALISGLPLYVSVYRSHGALSDIFSCVIAELGIKNTEKSEFLHIQSLAKEEMKSALLASAAIPLLFAPQQINNQIYSDGGQGGWERMQGNTPITPLLKSGYKMVIVTHLCDGSMWSRHDFPDTTIVEIRPSEKSITRGGEISDLLGFDSNKIPSWIEQGYHDTYQCLQKIIEATKSRHELRTSEKAVIDSEKTFLSLDWQMEDAMRRLI